MSITQSTINSQPQSSLTPTNNTNNNNYNQIFTDDDVQRFEATEYKQRYGEKWKKLATSVRDVVQPDGTIIREYVIEDPSLLDQLSEDENETNISNNSNSNINKNYLPINKSQINNNSNNNTSLQSASSFKMYENNKDEKYFQPITLNNNNKNVEDEVDKEVENIHQQGEQLRSFVNNNNNNKPQLEYEIVDENGNQIALNNAEQLKSLAAQVNEVVQPDGSIVKEYVLNDPQIIEQIRNRIKAESASAIIKPPAQFVDSNTTTASTENEKSLKQFFKPFIEPVLNSSSRKETKTPKQEEFINAWSSPNETNNNTKSIPFLTQIQNQIEKFQHKNKSNEQSLAVTTPAPVSIGQQQQQQQQLENKIASQLSNKYVSEIENDSHKSSIKQIKQNKFQLKTKKGKSLHFTITSDDPTESDIEEVKFIINKSIENLANENDQLNQENLFKKQITTSSAQNFSLFNNNEDKYFKSSSFQPNNHNTSPTSDQLVHKSGSAGCFKQPQQPPPPPPPLLQQQQQKNEPATSKTTPGGFLNANNSHIKHYPNMNPVNSSNKIYKIEPIHTSTSNNTPKSIYSNNLYNPTSSNSDSDENINQIISKATTITNPNNTTTNNNINKKNYLQRSNSFGTGQESTSSDTEFNYFRNKSKTNTTTTNFNNNNNNSKKQNIFNGGTYTKSTINFSHPSYDSDEYNYNNHTNSSKKYKLKTKLSKTPNQMNRSVNNIYNDSNLIATKYIGRDVTPEMTEQLLLKLLLQQISQKDQQNLIQLPAMFKAPQRTNNNTNNNNNNNINLIKDDYSSSSTIYNKNIVSETASLMMSPVDSSYSSKFNSIKNKLTHKSKNNFEFEVDDDNNNYEENNNNMQTFRRCYQSNKQHQQQTHYANQQQLLLKKPQIRSKKYTN